MNNLQKIFLMFLIGCIGLRSLFVIIAKYINTKYLKYLGYLALIPAIIQYLSHRPTIQNP